MNMRWCNLYLLRVGPLIVGRVRLAGRVGSRWTRRPFGRTLGLPLEKRGVSLVFGKRERGKWEGGEKGENRETLALAMFPIPRYTLLSRRCTSVRIILSSKRLSSVRRVSIRASAGWYCFDSSWLVERCVS